MSGSLLLRLVRRLTSLELQTIDDFIQVECIDRDRGGLDLAPSVFDVTESHVTQVTAEFEASFFDPRKRDQLALTITKVEGLDIAAVRADGSFAFMREQHREIRLFDVNELREFVQRMTPWFEHQRCTRASAMGAYVASRLAESDLEWDALCKVRTKWRAFAKKFEAQLEIPAADAQVYVQGDAASTEASNSVNESTTTASSREADLDLSAPSNTARSTDDA